MQEVCVNDEDWFQLSSFYGGCDKHNAKEAFGCDTKCQKAGATLGACVDGVCQCCNMYDE